MGLRAALVLTTCFALGGCVSVGGGSIPDTFTLSQITNMQTPASRSRRQILVAEPVALKTLDSEQILVRTSSSSVQYLSQAQWNDRLPKVFQTKLAAAYEISGSLGGVGLPGEGLAIDYQVATSIRAFEILAKTPRSAVIDISVKILNDRNGVVRAQKIFRSVVPINGSENEDYVEALDYASTEVVGDIVSWSLRYLK